VRREAVKLGQERLESTYEELKQLVARKEELEVRRLESTYEELKLWCMRRAKSRFGMFGVYL